LLFALFVNFFMALFFTGLVTFAYLLLRLAILVRERGTDGISGWIAEPQAFVLSNGDPHHVVANDPPPTGGDGQTQAIPYMHSEDESTLDEFETKTQR
jgi:hypothetical protein